MSLPLASSLGLLGCSESRRTGWAAAVQWLVDGVDRRLHGLRSRHFEKNVNDL